MGTKMLTQPAPTKRKLSLMFPYWEKILDALKNNDESEIVSIFKEIPSISIDYALMEKAEGVLMGEGDRVWPFSSFCL